MPKARRLVGDAAIIAAICANLVCVLEVAARVFDERLGFRDKVLLAINAMDSSGARRMTIRNWPAHALRVRDWRNPGATGQLDLFPGDLANERRKLLFIVGESAAYGWPYAYRDSLAGQLETLLGKDFKIVNAAQSGWTSLSLVAVVKRIADEFKPDVLVIFAGNNEWIHWRPDGEGASMVAETYRQLSRSSLVSWVLYHRFRTLASADRRAASSKQFLDQFEPTGFDYAVRHPIENHMVFDAAAWEAEKQSSLAEFEANVSQMTKDAMDAGAQSVLLTVPFNYRLSPAWKHPQPITFKRALEKPLRSLMDEASELLRRGEPELALAKSEEGLRHDPKSPLLSYVKAYALEKLGKLSEAEAAYAISRENMIGNLGSRTSINESIQRVSSRLGLSPLDIKEAFDEHARSRGRFFNADLIFDDCHPSVEGNRLIAELLAARLTAPAKGLRRSGERR